MKLPVIHGYIERRILINFTADPDDVRKVLPAQFTPKLYKGKAIVGICLIRLKDVKPKGMPDCMGISSENGAHRIAVEWLGNGERKEGVYVPRRDTSLKFNHLVGGRLFPGKHYRAKFDVQENEDHYHIGFVSSDQTFISIDARESESFASDSIFESLENASAFMKNGSIGYSPNGDRYEGLELNVYNWQVSPLTVSMVSSSFFEDEAVFPKGSVQFDNALLMTNMEHEWNSLADIKKAPLNQECF